ncbi:DUF6544 family protein [Kocuria flava]|uniref:DUF6544 family protein n=1 Tax=Kocuria flava TaxID=446860 RepID=UPI0027E390EA|nr:DUF6544 family protein [Kocuria flava]
MSARTGQRRASRRAGESRGRVSPRTCGSRAARGAGPVGRAPADDDATARRPRPPGRPARAGAAGRLAGESVTVPTACLGAVWSAGPDPDTAVLSWDLGGQREDCTLRVDPGGRLTELRMQRWGDPDGTGFARRPFGAAFTGEVVAGGVRLPERLRAGWDRGTARQAEGEFFRARIEGVILR